MMELTPEAVNAEVAYRNRDRLSATELQHVRAARASAPPRWWQRLLAHGSENSDRDDGNGVSHAA